MPEWRLHTSLDLKNRACSGLNRRDIVAAFGSEKVDKFSWFIICYRRRRRPTRRRRSRWMTTTCWASWMTMTRLRRPEMGPGASQFPPACSSATRRRRMGIRWCAARDALSLDMWTAYHVRLRAIYNMDVITELCVITDNMGKVIIWMWLIITACDFK